MNSSVVGKVYDDPPEKCGLFPDFQYSFWSSRILIGLLIVLGLLELWHLIYSSLSARFLTTLFYKVFPITLCWLDIFLVALTLMVVFHIYFAYIWNCVFLQKVNILIYIYLSIGDLFYCKLANNLLRNIKINKTKYYFKL